MREQTPASRQLRDRAEYSYEALLLIRNRCGKRSKANARFHRIDETEDAVVACRYLRIRRSGPEPLHGAMGGHRLVKTYEEVMAEVLGAFRASREVKAALAPRTV